MIEPLVTTGQAWIQKPIEKLEQVKLDAPTRVTKDLWSSLIDIRERINQEISEVSS